MNNCVNVEVRDALPDFVNHRLSELDAVTMREHIESCADCQAEVAILREVRASARLAPAMDVNRIASALPAYRAPMPDVSRVGSRRLWAIVATAAIVAVGGWGVTRQSVSDDSSPSVAVVAPSTTSIPAASTSSELPAPVIPSGSAAKPVEKPAEVQVASLSLVGATDDLSDADLETLVSALDGIDAMPSAEPGSVTTTVEDIDGNDQ